MTRIKKSYIVLLCLVFPAILAGCTQNDILYEADYNVTLDPSNTYYAGEPVRFNISGEIDNLLFYSGEPGSEYQYRDRYEVPMETVKSATLTLDIFPQYGTIGDGLDIYYTNTFAGLNRNDADADKALLKSLEKSFAAGDMQGWTEVEWVEKSGSITTVTIDVTEMKDNFVLAFHWHPGGDPAKDIQRTYSVRGELNTEIEGIGTATTDLGEFLVTTVMMNDERENPYATENAEGNIRFDDSNYDIKFQGVAAGKLDYSLDGWCVSFPQAFNSIPNDKGVVIKNMQNYMSTYEYTYDEPGTYNAVFVGRNANYLGTNEKVKELSIIIMDKLYFGDDEDGAGSGETE